MMGPGPGLDVEIIFALIGEDRDLMVETRAPRHEGDAFGPPLARAIGVGRMRYPDLGARRDDVTDHLARLHADEGLVHHRHIDQELLVGMIPVLARSEEHTSELQSLMRISIACFC